MTKTFEPIHDYRAGHKDRGGVYDAALAADPFDAYMHAWETRRVEELLRRHLAGRARRYLDFACGTGRMTAVIASFANEVVGIDISESMVMEARQKLPTAGFHVADITTSEVDLGRFDLVSSFRFFGNADHGLRQAVLRQLNRRMEPGALLVVNNHRNPQALMHRLARLTGGSIHMDLTPRKFRACLHDAGFDVVESAPIAAWQFRNALAMRAGSRPGLEARMEALFAASVFAPIAPDAVILARKVKDID
jgi:SAM-dependent methyltransferase